jgi:uncharacterized protein YhhL (DUF1145 family)
MIKVLSQKVTFSFFNLLYPYPNLPHVTGVAVILSFLFLWHSIKKIRQFNGNLIIE